MSKAETSPRLEFAENVAKLVKDYDQICNDTADWHISTNDPNVQAIARAFEQVEVHADVLMTDEYQAQGLRQLYYRLVVDNIIPNQERPGLNRAHGCFFLPPRPLGGAALLRGIVGRQRRSGGRPRADRN